MDGNHILQLTCSKCKKMNAVETDVPIMCSACKEPLTIKKSKSTAFAVIVAAAIGLGAGHTLDDSLEPHRYPVETEMAIIEECSSTGNGLAYFHYKNKREACACALVETQKHFDYEGFQRNQTEFLRTFRAQVMRCVE